MAEKVTEAELLKQGDMFSLWHSVNNERTYHRDQYDFSLNENEGIFTTFFIGGDESDLIAVNLLSVFEKAFQTVNPDLLSSRISEIVEGFAETYFDTYDCQSVSATTKAYGGLIAGFVSLLKIRGLSVRSNPTLKIVKKHAGLFHNAPLTSVEEVQQFLDPFAMRFGEKEYSFCRFFKAASDSETSTSSSRMMLHRLYSMLESEPDGETKLSDVSLIPFDDMVFDCEKFQKVMTLPFTTKEFREFLLDTKVSDVERLFGRLKKSGTGSESVRLSQSIIKAGLEPRFRTESEMLLEVNDTYNIFFKNLHTIFSPDDIAEINRVMLTERSKTSTIIMLRTIFENFDSLFTGWNKRSKMMSMFEYLLASPKYPVLEKIGWISSPAYSDSVMELILQEKSPVEVVNFFRFMATENHQLTMAHWLDYADNQEAFDLSPTSWWEDMCD